METKQNSLHVGLHQVATGIGIGIGPIPAFSGSTGIGKVAMLHKYQFCCWHVIFIIKMKSCAP